MDERSRFKVDYTFLPFTVRPHRGLLLANFNIPHVMTQDSGSMDNVIETITDFNNMILEQTPSLAGKMKLAVSATYNLKHRLNGQFRVYTGSFNVRYPERNMLTDYVPYQHVAQIRPVIVGALTDENVREKLIDPYSFDDTVWEFDSFISIIIQTQITTNSRQCVLAEESYRKRKTVYF